MANFIDGRVIIYCLGFLLRYKIFQNKNRVEDWSIPWICTKEKGQKWPCSWGCESKKEQCHSQWTFMLIIMIQRPYQSNLVMIFIIFDIPGVMLLENQHFVAIPIICFRGYMDTYNKMVGKPLIENSVATDVKRVQSILPTRIGIFPAKDWSTCFQIGSNFLQCPHQGA